MYKHDIETYELWINHWRSEKPGSELLASAPDQEKLMELWPANMEVSPRKHGALSEATKIQVKPTNQKKNVSWNGNVIHNMPMPEYGDLTSRKKNGNVIHKNPWGSGAPFMNRPPLDQGFGWQIDVVFVC